MNEICDNEVNEQSLHRWNCYCNFSIHIPLIQFKIQNIVFILLACYLLHLPFSTVSFRSLNLAVSFGFCGFFIKKRFLKHVKLSIVKKGLIQYIFQQIQYILHEFVWWIELVVQCELQRLLENLATGACNQYSQLEGYLNDIRAISCRNKIKR